MLPRDQWAYLFPILLVSVHKMWRIKWFNTAYRRREKDPKIVFDNVLVVRDISVFIFIWHLQSENAKYTRYAKHALRGMVNGDIFALRYITGRRKYVKSNLKPLISFRNALGPFVFY